MRTPDHFSRRWSLTACCGSRKASGRSPRRAGRCCPMPPCSSPLAFGRSRRIVPSSRKSYESRHGGRGRLLRACDRVLSVARRNPRRDRREDRSARRPDRDAPDATRSRRDRGHGDEEHGPRRRRVPRPRAPDALFHPVAQPGSLHLPPATQAVAVEPRGVAHGRGAVRSGDRARLATPPATRNRRRVGCACDGTPRDPVAPRSNAPGHVRRRSCVPERVARVRLGEAARAAGREGRCRARKGDAGAHRRPGAVPEERAT